MKIVLCVLILIAPFIAHAQSVFIQSKKYYAVFKDENRQDTAFFELPDIVGGVSNDIYHRLSPYLTADSILGENIDSVIANYTQYGAGFTSASYNILYNKNNVLSISVYIETLGAYPDSFYDDINLNVKTGRRILFSDIIKKSKMNELAARLDKIVQKRIKDKVKEEQMGEEDALQFFDGKRFSVDNLSSFAFKENGIMFYYNFNLPHALRALTPDEDMLMTWEDIEEYTREGSLLDKIINE